MLDTPDKLSELSENIPIEKVDTDTDAARVNFAAYVRARDYGHKDYVEKARKCDEYYSGQQWAEKDKKKLDNEGRPALTINLIRAVINAVLGEQISKRAEVKFKNKRGGSEAVAHLLTRLYSAIGDDNDLDDVESQVFADGIIESRGWFDVRIGVTENMQGEVEIISRDPRDVLLDPDAKEKDPTTWNEVIYTGWMSLDEIEATYGKDKAEELEQAVRRGHSRYSLDCVEFENEKTFGDTRSVSVDTLDVRSSAKENRAIRKIRVIDRQHYKLHTCRYFVDPTTGDSKEVSESWDNARAQEFAQRFGLFMHTKTKRKVRWTISAHDILLRDDWSPYRTFTLVPFFPFFRRGRTLGLVEDLLSPQDLVNKVVSQELHIVNTTANSGYIVEEGALAGMTTTDLKTKGSQTGTVITVARGRMDGLQKIQPNQIPTGLDRISAKAHQFIPHISGVNAAQLGTASPEMSGVVLQENKNSGSVQLDVPLANLTYTRKLLAIKILELVQDYYTEERVITVVDHVHPDTPPTEIVLNQYDAAGQIINDITVGEYEVIVSTQPARDSYLDSQFAEVMTMRKMGVMIPDDRVIELSNIENKFDLAKEIRQMTGRGQLTPEQQAMQQFQQEIMMRTAEGNVMKLYAEIEKLRADAAASAAKAGTVSQDLELRIRELEQEAAIAMRELQLRRELAVLGSMNKLDVTHRQHTAKLNQMLLERKLGDSNIKG